MRWKKSVIVMQRKPKNDYKKNIAYQNATNIIQPTIRAIYFIILKFYSFLTIDYFICQKFIVILKFH
ncbi:hypothetical protein COJ79_22860 [Bacillus thuringiensis]|nr:hypothetical protein CN486_31195 [Bacillus thuringiensis]PEZ29059.1 hypothetical protein CN346_25675 [Bacillus thuringiensis]PFF67375.1 hypothetical protein CN334_12820 [Bacillus thuringiensis]PFO12355.1 hypothetical protein COJ79_22860 [Bacillus thuringiensis]PGR96920.1 hypothetical protein COC68_14355 [Bacillus thuringiensis]